MLLSHTHPHTDLVSRGHSCTLVEWPESISSVLPVDDLQGVPARCFGLGSCCSALCDGLETNHGLPHHCMLFNLSAVSTSLWHHELQHLASLSLSISWSLPKFMCIESVMLSNHLIIVWLHPKMGFYKILSEFFVYYLELEKLIKSKRGTEAVIHG